MCRTTSAHQVMAWLRKSLWLGLTQAQERQKGLDELTRNVGPGFSLMLQFKAPWPTSRVDNLYKFSINERQHEALEQLAGQHPEAVQYVFPLYSKWSKADRYAPDPAQDTWLVPVSSIPLKDLRSISNPSSGRHRIELERTGSQVTVTVHSPKVMGEAVNGKEFFLERGGGQTQDLKAFGVASGLLQEWVGTWGERSAVRFRGLNALYVPVG